MLKFDSVFDNYAVNLAAGEYPRGKFCELVQFSQASEEKVIIDALNKLEIGSKSLIDKLPIKIIDTLFKLDSPKPEQWKQLLLPQMQSVLWMTWLNGWDLGLNHASTELNKKADFNRFANFDEFVKNRSIRNTPAEDAIRARINQLSVDVTNSEWLKIKDLLEQAMSPQPGSGEPISRAELIKGIEQELGVKSGRYANRAQTIARTELTFAYNAGRLQTYRDSGLVEAVKFYTILDERRCPICASRQELVIPLKNWRGIAANSPPMHPNCRCVLSPVLKKEKIELKNPNSKIENRELVPRPLLWSAAAILAAVLVGKSATTTTNLLNPTINAAVTLGEAVRLIRSEVGEKNAAYPAG
ncbi:MAG: minor capsid protein [Richelia sp. RM2_1_2]|nr:minor capsid protein [Richelia sp. RM2_1_2]